MKILEALTSVAGRISTGTAMAVAIATGLWEGHQGEIDPVRLGAVVTTTLAWLLAEIASGKKPSEHDLALFRRIVDMLPDRTTELLREHDFHNSFHGNLQDGVLELAEWRGPRNQFLDSALQKQWAAVHAQIRKLAEEFLVSVGPVRAGPLYSAHPENGDRDNPAHWVQERIDKLNKEAPATIKAIDEFEKYARNRLRL